ncbi:hypothetical protein [Halorubellus sp. PRR65]|uniref:hypothetical protein n=1 Tax=Halorubellus sp. PRR65 TaxID=3098148 RepID=UPI002B25C03C|nr:hypothetical protein [Halorubellus sp. PRR65]
MAIRQQLRRLLTGIIYSAAIVLGAGILVADPTSPLLGIPVLVGGGLIIHALNTAHLDELGYAIMGLWATLLVLSVSTGIAKTFLFSRTHAPIAEIPAAQVIGTLGLTIVLVGSYVYLLDRGRSDVRDPPSA